MDSSANSASNSASFSVAADIGDVAAQVLESLRQCLANLPADITPSVCAKDEAEILRIYDSFFQFAMKWTGETRRKYIGKTDMPEAAKFKKRAADVLNDLQARMKSFGLCSLRLQRTGLILAAHIRQYLEDNPEFAKSERIKWTSDTGVVINRYRKERQDITAQLEKFHAGLSVLAEADRHLIGFQSAMQKLYGADKAEDYIRSFRSALRMADFTKARKVLTGLSAAGAGVLSPAQSYLEALEKSAILITGREGKLFLAANELQTVLASLEQDLAQKNSFIEKYRLSGMENKQAGLAHLRDKLLVIGSLDSLMTLYIKLMRGLAVPMTDNKTLREYETNVLEKINYLLGAQFQEVEIIEQRNKDLLAEFFADQKDYKKGA